MGVMGHRRTPGVQHQGCADTGTQVFWVCGKGEQGLGGRREQETVEHRLVLVGDLADRRGQGKDHVVVLDRQEVCLTRFEPAPGGTGLTLGAMPVTAGVVGDLGMLAGLTLQHMTAECRTAALLDGRHDLELAEA